MRAPRSASANCRSEFLSKSRPKSRSTSEPASMVGRKKDRQMMKSLPRVGTKRVIDMHVHIGPEFLRRKYSAASLAAEARREGFGVVMKNHFQPTTAPGQPA